MVKPLIDDIKASLAYIIEWDEHNIPRNNNSKFEVYFNGLNSTVSYEKRLEELVDSVKKNILDDILDKPKIDQIETLKKIINGVNYYLKRFIQVSGFTTHRFLKKEYCRNDFGPSEQYFGTAASEIISEYIDLQYKSLENLKLFLEYLTELARRLPKDPGRTYELRSQIIMFYFLVQNGILDYENLATTDEKKAIFLAGFLNRSFSNLRRDLRFVFTSKYQKDYFKIQNLIEVRDIFAEAGMNDIEHQVQLEIEKIQPQN